MNRLPNGYNNLLPLPEAFGCSGFRGLSSLDEGQVLLVVLPLGSDLATRAERCGALARRWESLATGHPVLAQPLRWFLDGQDFVLVFRDPGGPLLSEMLDIPGGIFAWEKYLFPFIDQWERLETEGASWTSLDLRRMVLGPLGPVSFDLLHLGSPDRDEESWLPPFTSADDLLWLSPEMTRRTSWPVDVRSGLYTFGIFFFRVGSGVWPLVKADPLEMVHALLNQPPNPTAPRLRTLGSGFLAILKKLLQKDPRDRYQTLRGLKWDLGRRALAPEHNFILGTRDRLMPVSEIQRTYGRNAEREYLEEVLGRLKAGGPSVLVFRGAQGMGKTRLVEDLGVMAEAEGIFWAAGKFDQYDPRFTSGGLVKALGSWVESFGSLAAGVQGTLARALQAVLGRNLRLVTSLWTGLAPLVGSGGELPALGPDDQQKRFLAALVGLVRVGAEFRPFVLALEDLHWADDLSLRLLEALVENPVPGVALVGTCRPRGTDGANLLLGRVAGGPGPGTGLVDLGPLDEPVVQELLAECTELPAEDLRQLARILVRHSSGNPFNLRILLREVNIRQAAVFDESEGRWRLQAGKLRNLPFDGAADLVLDRVRDLGPGVRQALLVSSLLGVQFSREEVESAGPLDSGFFDLMADEFLDLGIWERVGPQEYRFTHDKLQQAVFEMASAEDRAGAHLRIGRDRLARRRAGAAVAPGAAAHHLNFAPGSLDEGERAELVDLNILAGNEVWGNGDPKAGLVFFHMAINLGGPALWAQDPDRAWALYKAAAETAYFERDRELADLWSEEAVSRCRYPNQRALIRERQQAYLFHLGDPRASVQAGLLGLRELGVTIPEQPSLARILGTLAQVKAAIGRRSPGDLVRLPENRDVRSRTALVLLAGFIPPTFLTGRDHLFALAVLLVSRLSLKDGLGPESAPGFTGYAIILAALGDHRGAREAAVLAAGVNARFEDPAWRSMVLTLTNLFSFGWSEPWDLVRGRIDGARKASLDRGAVLYRTYDYLFASLWNQGEDLTTRIKLTEEALSLADGGHYPQTRVAADFVLGTLRHLGNPEPGPLDPDRSGSAFLTQPKSGLAVCWSALLQASFLLGDLELAREALGRVRELRVAVAGSLFDEEMTLFSGLVSADLVRRKTPGARDLLGAWGRQTRGWARRSPMFRFHRDLLAAEALDLRGRYLKAQYLYFQAVEGADLTGNLAYRALARERAGHFHRRRGFLAVARNLFDESLDFWRRYGAWAKVSLLEAEAGVLPGGGRVRNPGVAPPWDIDSVSLVRALDAISAEIQTDKLIRSVSKLILENSGADRVALLVDRSGVFALEGEASLGGFRPGNQVPLDQVADLPRSFLRKVVQDKLPLVRETLSEAEYRREPVLAARGVKSLICLPLGTQDDLKGLVYLENTVSPGILTKERVRTIERLSSTIGIALQNAQLFEQVRQVNESLERRVEERTRELQLSQKKFVLQEKLASLGALTAGIAHELKNPLNIITNFAESSIELMGELEGALEPLAGTLPPGVQKELDYLIPELVQNMKDLRVQGERGDGIIRSMLMHSRADAGVPTLEDLGTLVKESLALSYHGIRATQKDFRCRTEERYEPGVPPVRMIRPNLGRVLINLFSNAFQAVLEKQRRLQGDYEPLVTVAVDRTETGVLLTVEDNGPGIPPEIQEKIFQPFFTTKPPGEGTGLGLSISFEIIQEELGGSLEVESLPGSYTRFLVKIPVNGPPGTKE